jgi:hypothetical protein
MRGKGPIRPKKAKLRRPALPSSSSKPSPSTPPPQPPPQPPTDPLASAFPRGAGKVYFTRPPDEAADRADDVLNQPLPHEESLRAKLWAEYADQVTSMGAVITPTLTSMISAMTEDRITLAKAYLAINQHGTYRRNRKTGEIKYQAVQREIIGPTNNSLRMSTRLFLDEIGKQCAANGGPRRAPDDDPLVTQAGDRSEEEFANDILFMTASQPIDPVTGRMRPRTPAELATWDMQAEIEKTKRLIAELDAAEAAQNNGRHAK